MTWQKFTATAGGWLALAFAGAALADFPQKQYAVHITRFSGTTPDAGVPFVSRTFPITIESDDGTIGMYYAQQGYFEHPTADSELYYTGIQPQGDGTARVLFSLFGGKGARIIDTQNCKSGADDLAIGGVTCATVTIPFQYGVIYNFTASLTQHTDKENIWAGVVEDTSTGKVTAIGSWATPAALGYMTGEHVGFVEDYSGIKNCSEISPNTVVFGGPASRVEGRDDVFKGRLDNATYSERNGVCKNKVAYSSTQLPDGGIRIEQEQGMDWPE